MNLPNEKSLPLSFANCVLIYVCLTSMCLVLHDRMVDTPAYEARKELHANVIANRAPAPLQYRIITFYSAEALQRLGISFKASYLVIRGITTLLSVLLLHKFLALFYPTLYCFLGSLLLLAVTPFTYINYYMQETDPLNLAFFITAYILIQKRKDGWLAAMLPLAMINRETPVILPLLWLLYRWDELKPFHLAARFSFYCILCLAPYAGLRAIYGHHPTYYSEIIYLNFNLKDIKTYLYSFLIITPFLWIAIANYKKQPKFLQRALLFVPFFLIFHLIFTIFQETRLLLPIMPLIIASTFIYWFQTSDAKPKNSTAHSINTFLTANTKVFYSLVWIAFFAGMHVFRVHSEQTHLAKWRNITTAKEYMNEGYSYYKNGDYKEAVNIWSKGCQLDPDNFELHYNIAVVALQQLRDPILAKLHFKECEKIKQGEDRLKSLATELSEYR